MKSLLASIAAAGLAGCVAYNPYAYRAPPATYYYPSVPVTEGTTAADGQAPLQGFGTGYVYPTAYAAYPYTYVHPYPYYAGWYPYYPRARFGVGVRLGYWWGGGGHYHGHRHHHGGGRR